MHLLEAWLALAEVDPASGYQERAAGLVTLFRTRLFRANQAILPEYFSSDWSDHPDPELGFFEPGHHFEWVWLLDRHARLTGDRLSLGDDLFRTARAYGPGSAGMVVDQVDPRSGKPGGAFRLWPQTEAIRAALVRARAGERGATDMAEHLAAQLRRTFLGRPFAAGWIDRCDGTGEALTDHVPASSLYHLATAVFEIREALDEKRQASHTMRVAEAGHSHASGE